MWGLEEALVCITLSSDKAYKSGPKKEGFILICFSKSYIHKWLPCFISPLHGELGWLSGEKKKKLIKNFLVPY